MFNYNRISDLLKERNLKKKQLIEAVGINTHTTFESLNRNIRVDTLEKIADFFGVPTDYFFERKNTIDGLSIHVNRNHLQNVNINSVLESNEHYKELLTEKDKRIRLLEEMIEVLKSQNSDKSRT